MIILAITAINRIYKRQGYLRKKVPNGITDKHKIIVIAVNIDKRIVARMRFI
jgi:hypothetical protein